MNHRRSSPHRPDCLCHRSGRSGGGYARATGPPARLVHRDPSTFSKSVRS